MKKLYPNVEQLAAALPENSVARTLCNCFVGVKSQREAEAKVRALLDRMLAELRQASAEGDDK